MRKFRAAGIALTLSLALAVPATAMAEEKADATEAVAKPAQKGFYSGLKGWWGRTKAKAKKAWGKVKAKAKKAWGKAKTKAKKAWGKLKGSLRKEFGNMSSIYMKVRSRIGGYLMKIGGKQGRAFLALARVLAEISRRSRAMIKKLGGAKVGLRKFYRTVARSYIAGAIKRGLRLGKGLGKWLQEQFRTQSKRFGAIAEKLKIEPEVVNAIGAFGKRVLDYVRAVAGGKAKLSKSAIGKVLSGYGKAFGSAVKKLVRFAKAAPKRAKALFKKYFGKFAGRLLGAKK